MTFMLMFLLLPERKTGCVYADGLGDCMIIVDPCDTIIYVQSGLNMAQ